MKKLLCVLCVLCAAPVAAQDHTAIVAAVKSGLQARGVDLSGPCGAFQITKRVAWMLKAEGAGLLSKPSGNNCEGYATDIIAFPGGHIFDILVSGGDVNGPSWQDAGSADTTRYRAAFDPGDVIAPPPPPLPPTLPAVQVCDLSSVLNKADEILNAVNDGRGEQQDNTKAIRGDIADFREAVKSKWAAAMTFGAKYILPAVAGLVGGWKLK